MEVILLFFLFVTFLNSNFGFDVDVENQLDLTYDPDNTDVYQLIDLYHQLTLMYNPCKTFEFRHSLKTDARSIWEIKSQLYTPKSNEIYTECYVTLDGNHFTLVPAVIECTVPTHYLGHYAVRYMIILNVDWHNNDIEQKVKFFELEKHWNDHEGKPLFSTLEGLDSQRILEAYTSASNYYNEVTGWYELMKISSDSELSDLCHKLGSKSSVGFVKNGPFHLVVNRKQMVILPNIFVCQHLYLSEQLYFIASTHSSQRQVYKINTLAQGREAYALNHVVATMMDYTKFEIVQ